MIEIFVKDGEAERGIHMAHYKTDADGNRTECTDARLYSVGTVLAVETKADGSWSVEEACRQEE